MIHRVTWRQAAAVTVLTATIATFTYYFAHHPEVGHQLRHTSPDVIGVILALYLISVGVLALINHATVKLCDISLARGESLLLTAYAAVINFFGPLQSGPAFRAVYLKKKHHVNLKNYGLATLMYYFFFGGFSGLLLLSGLLKGWLILLVLVGLMVMLVIWKSQRFGAKLKQLNLGNWYYLALATLLQVLLMTLIYYVELRSVAPGTGFSQAVIYTGAANLALFVSLTPGAIGFRESFLLFSQNLHHINSTTIVAANILDRAMYLVLLLILTVFIFGTHAKKRLATSASD
ncbi:MAG: lysylphosphatidylglycerol synthase domain-containing protein [Candidatus Saccharimonadales bacterium]